MSIELMTKAFKAKVGNPLRKLVLIKLADNANDQGVCYPSYQYVADQCEISRRSVIEHVKALQNMGVLTVKKRFNDGENTSNAFRICAKKLNELCSAPDSLGSERAALGSANGAKKRAPDSLGSERAAPPLVKELHPEPSLSNHHLTINESSLNQEREESVVTTVKKNHAVPEPAFSQTENFNHANLPTTNRTRQAEAPTAIVSMEARSLTAKLHKDTAKRIAGFTPDTTRWADETAIAKLLKAGVTQADIETVWAFATTKPFWAGKIATPKDLVHNWVKLSQEVKATTAKQTPVQAQETKDGYPVLDREGWTAKSGEGWYTPWGTREGWHDGVFFENDCEMMGATA